MSENSQCKHNATGAQSLHSDCSGTFERGQFRVRTAFLETKAGVVKRKHCSWKNCQPATPHCSGSCLSLSHGNRSQIQISIQKSICQAVPAAHSLQAFLGRGDSQSSHLQADFASMFFACMTSIFSSHGVTLQQKHPCTCFSSASMLA